MTLQRTTLNTVLAVLLLSVIGSCTRSTTNESDSADTAASQSEEEKDSNIAEVLNHYFHIKNALVESDLEKTQAAAGEFLKSSAERNETYEALESSLKEMESAKSLEDQRFAFEKLSDEMYELLKASDSVGETVYRQYCPMAFNNQGAYWLSGEKEIMNPYFGDQMLHCGSVKEEI